MKQMRSIAVKAYVSMKYWAYKHLPKNTYPTLLKIFFRSELQSRLDLNTPKTLNEKIQWLKLYDSTEIKTRLADKYLVRDWISEQIGSGHLIPLIGVYDSFEQIDFDKLPDQFVLKCNHGSGCNLIVKNKAEMDKKTAQRYFRKWLQTNYAYFSGELHYEAIKPRIIVEKYIENEGGLQDYRFYCFNGEPKLVWFDIFSGTINHKRNIYDIEWNLIPVKCKWPFRDEQIKKPKCFDEMVCLARKLSKDFCFVRVDFYEVDGQIYFGEMTFTPMSGEAGFEPKEYDEIFGNMLTLPAR